MSYSYNLNTKTAIQYLTLKLNYVRGPTNTYNNGINKGYSDMYI
jgi:hypothetical protein